MNRFEMSEDLCEDNEETKSITRKSVEQKFVYQEMPYTQKVVKTKQFDIGVNLNQRAIASRVISKIKPYKVSSIDE